MPKSVAITTTTRNAGETLDHFIRYHLALGFAHIFLFFDDPQDPAIFIANRFPAQVTIIPTDDVYKQNRPTNIYPPHFRATLNPHYLMDRMLINAAVAVRKAVSMGIEWLLHIDQDELFHSPAILQGNKTLSDYFTLAEQKKYDQLIFLNHEAIVEKTDIAMPFQEVTLFKRNPKLISNTEQFPDPFFLNYVIGKAAVKVTESTVPDGVHEWLQPRHLTRRSFLRRKIFLRNRLITHSQNHFPRLTDLWRRGLGDHYKNTLVSSDPVILHYLNCGFERFWEKYARLNYLNQLRTAQQKHIAKNLADETDSILHIVDKGKDATRAYYQDKFVLDDLETADRLIEQGVLERVTGPADWFGQARSHVIPA